MIAPERALRSDASKFHAQIQLATKSAAKQPRLATVSADGGGRNPGLPSLYLGGNSAMRQSWSFAPVHHEVAAEVETQDRSADVDQGPVVQDRRERALSNAQQRQAEQAEAASTAASIAEELEAGRSLDLIAEERGLTRDEVVAELEAAGYEVDTTGNARNGSDPRVTTIEDPQGGRTVTETERYDGTYEIAVEEDGETTTVVIVDGKETELAQGQEPTKEGCASILEDVVGGKSLDEIAEERGLTREQVIAQLEAAGYKVETTGPSSGNGDVERTEIIDAETDAVVAGHYSDHQHGAETIRYVDDEGNAVSRTEYGDGRVSETVTDKGGRQTTTVTEPVNGDEPVEYEVQEGDNLTAIAEQYGITLEELEESNPDYFETPRDPDLIYPGETILIEDGNAGDEAEAATQEADEALDNALTGLELEFKNDYVADHEDEGVWIDEDGMLHNLPSYLQDQLQEDYQDWLNQHPQEIETLNELQLDYAEAVALELRLAALEAERLGEDPNQAIQDETNEIRERDTNGHWNPDSKWHADGPDETAAELIDAVEQQVLGESPEVREAQVDKAKEGQDLDNAENLPDNLADKPEEVRAAEAELDEAAAALEAAVAEQMEDLSQEVLIELAEQLGVTAPIADVPGLQPPPLADLSDEQLLELIQDALGQLDDPESLAGVLDTLDEDFRNALETALGVEPDQLDTVLSDPGKLAEALGVEDEQAAIDALADRLIRAAAQAVNAAHGDNSYVNTLLFGSDDSPGIVDQVAVDLWVGELGSIIEAIDPDELSGVEKELWEAGDQASVALLRQLGVSYGVGQETFPEGGGETGGDFIYAIVDGKIVWLEHHEQRLVKTNPVELALLLKSGFRIEGTDDGEGLFTITLNGDEYDTASLTESEFVSVPPEWLEMIMAQAGGDVASLAALAGVLWRSNPEGLSDHDRRQVTAYDTLVVTSVRDQMEATSDGQERWRIHDANAGKTLTVVLSRETSDLLSVTYDDDIIDIINNEDNLDDIGGALADMLKGHSGRTGVDELDKLSYTSPEHAAVILQAILDNVDPNKLYNAEGTDELYEQLSALVETAGGSWAKQFAQWWTAPLEQREGGSPGHVWNPETGYEFFPQTIENAGRFGSALSEEVASILDGKGWWDADDQPYTLAYEVADSAYKAYLEALGIEDAAAAMNKDFQLRKDELVPNYFDRIMGEDSGLGEAQELVYGDELRDLIAAGMNLDWRNDAVDKKTVDCIMEQMFEEAGIDEGDREDTPITVTAIPYIYAAERDGYAYGALFAVDGPDEETERIVHGGGYATPVSETDRHEFVIDGGVIANLASQADAKGVEIEAITKDQPWRFDSVKHFQDKNYLSEEGLLYLPHALGEQYGLDMDLFSPSANRNVQVGTTAAAIETDGEKNWKRVNEIVGYISVATMLVPGVGWAVSGALRGISLGLRVAGLTKFATGATAAAGGVAKGVNWFTSASPKLLPGRVTPMWTTLLGTSLISAGGSGLQLTRMHDLGMDTDWSNDEARGYALDITGAALGLGAMGASRHVSKALAQTGPGVVSASAKTAYLSAQTFNAGDLGIGVVFALESLPYMLEGGKDVSIGDRLMAMADAAMLVMGGMGMRQESIHYNAHRNLTVDESIQTPVDKGAEHFWRKDGKPKEGPAAYRAQAAGALFWEFVSDRQQHHFYQSDRKKPKEAFLSHAINEVYGVLRNQRITAADLFWHLANGWTLHDFEQAGKPKDKGPEAFYDEALNKVYRLSVEQLAGDGASDALISQAAAEFQQALTERQANNRRKEEGAPDGDQDRFLVEAIVDLFPVFTTLRGNQHHEKDGRPDGGLEASYEKAANEVYPTSVELLAGDGASDALISQAAAEFYKAFVQRQANNRWEEEGAPDGDQGRFLADATRTVFPQFRHLRANQILERGPTDGGLENARNQATEELLTASIEQRARFLEELGGQWQKKELEGVHPLLLTEMPSRNQPAPEAGGAKRKRPPQYISLCDEAGHKFQARVYGDPPEPDKIYIPPHDDTRLHGDDPSLFHKSHILVRDPETGAASVLPWIRGGSEDHAPASSEGTAADAPAESPPKLEEQMLEAPPPPPAANDTKLEQAWANLKNGTISHSEYQLLLRATANALRPRTQNKYSSSKLRANAYSEFKPRAEAILRSVAPPVVSQAGRAKTLEIQSLEHNLAVRDVINLAILMARAEDLAVWAETVDIHNIRDSEFHSKKRDIINFSLSFIEKIRRTEEYNQNLVLRDADHYLSQLQQEWQVELLELLSLTNSDRSPLKSLAYLSDLVALAYDYKKARQKNKELRGRKIRDPLEASRFPAAAPGGRGWARLGARHYLRDAKIMEESESLYPLLLTEMPSLVQPKDQGGDGKIDPQMSRPTMRAGDRGPRARQTIELVDETGQVFEAKVYGPLPKSRDNVYIPPHDDKRLRGDDPRLFHKSHILFRDPETGEASVLPWIRGGSEDHVPRSEEIAAKNTLDGLVDPQFRSALAEHIRSQGEITFADFMNISLYGIDGEGGYYNSGNVAIGGEAADHFLTAPELSPAFGHTIGNALAEMFQAMGCPERFDVVEMGAGNGTLARDVIDRLQAEHPDVYHALNYVIVERSQGLITRQRAKLEGEERVSWVHASADALPLGNLQGVILSNELVDAFPAHRAVWLPGGRIEEIYVTVDGNGRFIEKRGEPSPKLSVALQEPAMRFLLDSPNAQREQTLTINARAISWMKDVYAALDKGFVITIDYGQPGSIWEQPYCFYRGKRPVEWAYRNPGAIDITAKVDPVILLQLGEQVGLRPARSVGVPATGFEPQEDFLRRYGLGKEIMAVVGTERHNAMRLGPFSRGFFALTLEKDISGSVGQVDSGEGEHAQPAEIETDASTPKPDGTLSAAYHNPDESIAVPSPLHLGYAEIVNGVPVESTFDLADHGVNASKEKRGVHVAENEGRALELPEEQNPGALPAPVPEGRPDTGAPQRRAGEGEAQSWCFRGGDFNLFFQGLAADPVAGELRMLGVDPYNIAFKLRALFSLSPTLQRLWRDAVLKYGVEINLPWRSTHYDMRTKTIYIQSECFESPIELALALAEELSHAIAVNRGHLNSARPGSSLKAAPGRLLPLFRREEPGHSYIEYGIAFDVRAKLQEEGSGNLSVLAVFDELVCAGQIDVSGVGPEFARMVHIYEQYRDGKLRKANAIEELSKIKERHRPSTAPDLTYKEYFTEVTRSLWSGSGTGNKSPLDALPTPSRIPEAHSGNEDADGSEGRALALDMSNKAAFINSLFDTDVRDWTVGGLQGAIEHGKLVYSYADAASRGLILNAWLAAWSEIVGAPFDSEAAARCPQSDRMLIEMLVQYTEVNQLSLSTPALSLDHLQPGTNLAVYRNAGYDRAPFVVEGQWNLGAFDSDGNLASDASISAAARLLEHLYYGAHIVVISSSKDRNGGNPVGDLRSTLQSQLSTRTDLLNSHYKGSGFASGLYYVPAGAPDPSATRPDVETLAASNPAGAEPLISSLLVGITARTYQNDFLQLEGWPTQTALRPPGGSRHNSDFQANEATLWNFSTFGCCAYSEKRSTPIFLANSAFDLTIQQDTHMPYYWGANAGNAGAAWLHPELVVVTSNYPGGSPDPAASQPPRLTRSEVRAIACNDIKQLNMADFEPSQIPWFTPDQVAQFTKLQFQDLNAAGLQGHLTKSQLQAIPENKVGHLDVTGLAAKQIPWVTSGQAAKLTKQQLQNLNQSGLLVHLTKSQLQAIPVTKIGHLDVAKLDARQIPWLTSGQVAKLTKQKLQDLSEAGLQVYFTRTQLRAIPKTKIGSLDVAKLDAKQIPWLTLEQVAELTTKQFEDLSNAGLQVHFTRTQLRAIPKSKIRSLDVAKLTAKQFPGLTGGHVAKLTKQQFQDLSEVGLHAKFTKTQLQAVPESKIEILDVAKFDLKQVPWLTSGQMAALTEDQLGAFTVQQIETLTRPQIKAMKPEQFADLDPGQFRKFTPEQLTCMTLDQLNALSVLQLTTYRATHKNNLTPVQAAKIKDALSRARAKELRQAILTFGVIAGSSTLLWTALPQQWVVTVGAAATAARGLAFGVLALAPHVTAPHKPIGRLVNALLTGTHLATLPGAPLAALQGNSAVINGMFTVGNAINSTKTAQEVVAGRPVLRNVAEHGAGPLAIAGCFALTVQSWPSPGFTTAFGLFTFGCAHFWAKAIRDDLANRRPVPRTDDDIAAAAQADARWNMSGRIILGVTISLGMMLIAWSTLKSQSEENDSAEPEDDALPPPDSSSDAPPVSVTPAEQFPQLVVLSEDGLNLRAQPDGDSERVTVMEPGTSVEQTGQPSTKSSGDVWIPVEGFGADGESHTGWVTASFVAPQANGAHNEQGRFNPELENSGYDWVDVQQPGQSIGNIAREHSMDVAETLMLNMDHIVNPNQIFAGDRIYLPAAT